MCAAVHARSVIHDDASYHGALHRCRVGSKLTPVGSEQFVDALADEARLKSDLFVVGADAVSFPVLACHNQDGVADGLSGQAGSCGTESDRQFVARGQTEELRHFVFVFRADDYLRNEAVEAGVCAPGQAAQFVGINTFLRNEGLCFA